MMVWCAPSPRGVLTRISFAARIRARTTNSKALIFEGRWITNPPQTALVRAEGRNGRRTQESGTLSIAEIAEREREQRSGTGARAPVLEIHVWWLPAGLGPSAT